MFYQSVCSNTNFFIYQCELFLLSRKYLSYKKILTMQPAYRFFSIDIFNLILRTLQSSLISLKFLSVMGTTFMKKFLEKVS